MSDKMLQPLSKKIGFVGGGNMAKAICEGMVQKGLIQYTEVYVSGPHLENLKYWSAKGANISTVNGDVADEADVIFLAVKPHILPVAMNSMLGTCDLQKCSNKLFISIIAGTLIHNLELVLSMLQGARVVRVMPNTPLVVAEGCTVYCPGRDVTDADIAIVKSVFGSTGLCQSVPENMINAYGALAGSGPAYIYLAIEALSDGGVKVGIPRDMATKCAAQAVLGAAKMVLETGKHPGVLKDEVCSPGGSTICAIHALEKGGLRAALIDAVESACKRTEEVEQKHN